MFYVNVYDESGQLMMSSPFDDKNKAISYFNMRVDAENSKFFAPLSRIEFLKDNLVLFESEVF